MISLLKTLFLGSKLNKKVKSLPNYTVSPLGSCFLSVSAGFKIFEEDDCCSDRNMQMNKKEGSFPFVPPSLVGAYYLHPPDARAIFLHNDLLCNGTCSVTGGRITYWGRGGGTNGKDPKRI